jgi:hypothetical protein
VSQTGRGLSDTGQGLAARSVESPRLLRQKGNPGQVDDRGFPRGCVTEAAVSLSPSPSIVASRG